MASAAGPQPAENIGGGQKPGNGSSEDFAGQLLGKNPAVASVLRDLQARHKQRKAGEADGGEGGEDAIIEGTASDPDIERGNMANMNSLAEATRGPSMVAMPPGVFFVGGATTMHDYAGVAATHIRLDGQQEETKGGDQKALPVVAATLGSVPIIPVCKGDVKAALTDETDKTKKGRLKSCWTGIVDSCKEVADIIMLHPATLIVPLVVFMLLCGLGVWGVMAGADSYVQQQKDDVRGRAVDAVTGFQIQLQQSFTPGLTFQLLVKQRPDMGYWIENFNTTAEELMQRVPTGSLYNLQLQPFSQVSMIYPFRYDLDYSQVNPPRDLIGDPTRRDDIFKIIQSHEPLVVGPVVLADGKTIGAFVRYPIFVQDVDRNETFGFQYIHPTYSGPRGPLPFDGLPASVRRCLDNGLCYNETTREKWWGVMTVLINYDAVTQGQDAYLANLRKMGYNYALVRPINETTEQVIARVGPTSLRDTDAVTVEVKVFGRVWFLRVSPSDGFEPGWRAPLIAAVVIISFIIALLLFVAMASFKRQRLLLQETVAANWNLAQTTKRLEEEKERMDVLLVRQYDLLRCLDANRSDGKLDMSDAVGASKKAMMARIEDARRSLNVAKAAVEDPIQVFEILGMGAFGKVQKGLWRGTVVAVKTMILPANMTGQQKREKMAVMEAAISSSLVHPNIVITYTYFIRPYHEPVHEGVQNMMIGNGSGSGIKSNDSPTSGGESTSSDATIHSYEVRLVLEFCDKGSLKDALDQHAFMQGGSLNLSAMLETAADVAKAMVHMHAANVLHSDLKARNIMLKSSGTEGRGVVAKVADFGLSTRMEHQETHLSSCFQGTLTHMAPEVMLEGRISKAADVYSFGILLWELFCASDPFSGVPRAHLGHAITKENRRPKFPPFAPQTYVSLASRCWDPDATLRPTFEEVLTELVRLRDELGGDTPQLVVTPPKPLSNDNGGEGDQHNSEGAGPLGGGGSPNGFHLPSGGASTLLGAGIVLGGGSSTSMAGHSAMASRSMIKSAQAAQRQLRKMGLRLGGTGISGLAPALPALHEEPEHKADDTEEAPLEEEVSELERSGKVKELGGEGQVKAAAELSQQGVDGGTTKRWDE